MNAHHIETVRQIRADWERVKREFIGLKIKFAMWRYREALVCEAENEAKYSPDQPRVPAGQSGGGQWTSGGGVDAVNVSDGGNGNDLLAPVLDPGSGGNGGGNGPNGCAAAFAACEGYAMRLFDLGWVQESFELRQSCFVHTNYCFALDATVQSLGPLKVGQSFFPPDFEKGGGGLVLHMYGKTPVYIPPATDPLANIGPAK